MQFAREIGDLEAMAAFARLLARVLRPGDVLGLDGPLGAGKTTLVRMLAGELGADTGLVSSPTFVIAAEYPCSGGVFLTHVDAYRVRNSAELEGTGWDERTGDEIAVVEWSERIADVLGKDAARVRIVPTGQNSRRVEVALPESWGERPEVAGLLRGDTTCPVTGRRVLGENPHWPFVDERARLADLYRWFSGERALGRPVGPEDDDEAASN